MRAHAREASRTAAGSTVQMASKSRCGSGTVDCPGSSQAVSTAGYSAASQTTAHSRRIGASSGRVTNVVAPAGGGPPDPAGEAPQTPGGGGPPGGPGPRPPACPAKPPPPEGAQDLRL